MIIKLFANLSIKDLNKKIDCFAKFDFKFNLKFTYQNTNFMISGNDSSVMLLVEKFFKIFAYNDLRYYDKYRNLVS